MNRIKELREAKGWTQLQLAEAAGTTDATVQRIEAGKRNLTQKWITRFSAALECHPAETLEKLPPITEGVPILGSVQAGLWREIDAEPDALTNTLPVGYDSRYPTLTQYSLLVIGDSMNKVFPDGQYIICVPWPELGRALKNGDLVVVERRKPGMTEATVKRVKIAKGLTQLMPESTNPRWQSPVLLNGAEDDDIVVTGLVIGRYEPL